MPEFLAETYSPRGASPPPAGDIVRAAGQASGHEAPVRFLGAIAVPEEETCFWLFQAPAAGAVRAAMTRAGLRPERITPAVSIRPPHDGPGGPAPRTGSTAGPPATSSRPPGPALWGPAPPQLSGSPPGNPGSQ